MSPTALSFLPATELAARIRRRDLSPVEVVDACLARIEARNPSVNAFTLVLAEQAREAARRAEAEVVSGAALGALHGVPVAIKDLDDLAGVPTSMGSRAVENRVPRESATSVARMLAAGAIPLGKTNTPEFGHKGITDNLRFGPTSTPYAIGHNSGGSSGGSAAAVADGMAAIGQGTDGGGSVRIPASFCGAVGFKPSFGRIPSVTRPDAFLWSHPLVHIGPLTRTVADAALALSVMAGPHPRDPSSLPAAEIDWLGAAARAPLDGTRAAFCPTLGDFPVDPAVADVIASAVRALDCAPVTVEEVALADMPGQAVLGALWVKIIGVHYGAISAQWKAEGIDLAGALADRLTPEFRQILEDAPRVNAVELALDDLIRSRVYDAFETVFETHDFILSPTLAVPPVKNRDDGHTLGPREICGIAVDPLIGWCMTHPVNFTGHPAVSVPAGLTPDGLPIGLQIIGRRFDDAGVLRIAAHVERVRPWFQSYPGVATA